MKRVFKYPLPMDDRPAILMPAGAEVLSVATQGGAPMVWALVDPECPPERICFRMAGTGHPIEDADLHYMRFLGTFQMHGGALVFHVWTEAPR